MTHVVWAHLPVSDGAPATRRHNDAFQARNTHLVWGAHHYNTLDPFKAS